MLVYTGHYLAHAPDAGQIRTFVIRAPGGLRLVIGGEVATEEMAWTDRTGQGTYAYVGDAEPVASSHVIGVVDRGLPTWIRSLTDTALVELFELYADRTGFALEGRPSVLLGWAPSDSPGLSSGGGTLPNLIQMGLEGTAWSTESADAREHLLHFIAHEAAHMWNGEMVTSRDPTEAWIHEGGADAFADRALLALGVSDSTRFDGRLTQAFNECAQGLGGLPLRESGSRGRSSDYYSCGSVLNLWIEASLRAAQTGYDLFDFWALLIGRARTRQDRAYAQSDVASLVTELTGADAAGVFAGITDERHDDTGAYLARALRSVGVTVAPDSTAGGDGYRRSMGRSAVAALMREDCDGGVDFHNHDEHAEIGERASCRTLEAGSRIVRLEGAAVYREGHIAYDRVRTRCATGEPVRVARPRGVELAVPCSQALAHRSPLFRVSFR